MVVVSIGRDGEGGREEGGRERERGLGKGEWGGGSERESRERERERDLAFSTTPIPSGKSTLLATIADRDIPIPDHVDIFHLSEEIPASDKTPLQCVMEVDDERQVSVCCYSART